MVPIFRPSTFNRLKPLIQQRYAKMAFNTIRPQPCFHDISLQEPIRNQTHVSTTLATHLLSKKPNSNVVFSPLSINVVLSLLAAGSKGETLDQLLGFLKASTINDLNYLYRHVVSSILADGSPRGGPRLACANGVWVDQTVSLKPPFECVVDDVYKADCKQVDFQKAVEVANEVNVWAEKKTNGFIKEVIGPDAIEDQAWLIFANAVYFKGVWKEKFNPSRTQEHDFHLLDGSKVQVPFMTNTKNQFVSEYDGFKVLGLPYLQGKDDRRFTMYFYLPDEKDGLQSLIQKMGSTSDFFDSHIPRYKAKVGKFLVPKFKISFGFEASNMLKELGLVLPFSMGHMLTEMVDRSGGEGVYVSSIHHIARVEVNEEGTEAAAVTTAVTSCGSSLFTKDWVDFLADHPFLFVIREDVTGVVLFMGQVNDPRVECS